MREYPNSASAMVGDAMPAGPNELGYSNNRETVEDVGVLTPHFETDDVPNAPRQRDLC